MDQKSYLVVDDDNVFREKLTESLKTRGYSTYSASGIDEAKNLVEKFNIDRVILDLKLDQENGLDFLHNIEKSKLEVVILTGYGSVNTVKLAFKRGAINYIQKPATIEEIINSFSPEFIEAELSPSTTLDEVEKDHINRVLVEQNGNISKTAKILGLHRRSLQRKLKGNS